MYVYAPVPEPVPQQMPQSRQMFGPIAAPEPQMEPADAGGTITAPIALFAPWGQSIAANDVDGLIEAYEQVDRVYREAREFRAQVANALLTNTEGDKRTRRVRGQSLQAKVELADDSWDGKLLREAWETFPQYRDQALKIESVKVMKREWNKVANTTGPEDFNAFRDLVTRANLGSTGTPKITVEKAGEADRV